MLFRSTLTLVIFLLRATNSTCFNPDDDYYDPPKYNEDVFRPVPVQLGEDEFGCICREIPNTMTICFGISSCSYVPTNFNITTPILSIISTHISEIISGGLNHLYFLKDLKIEGNYNLTRISAGIFGDNFTKLENLSISFNKNLRYLNPDTFVGLGNLKQLFLIKNGLTNLYDVTLSLSPTVLPNLRKLSLNENNFTTISEGDFSAMEDCPLEELDLILCSLQLIHAKALLPLRNLQALRAGENFFNSTVISEVLNEMNKNKTPLKLLNLYSAGFRVHLPQRLLQVIAGSNITNLNLAKNLFQVIPSGVFPLMPSLRSLDLKEALISDIADDAFINLPNLRSLTLSDNNLATIPKGVLLKNLSKLNIRGNTQNSAKATYFEIQQGTFLHMGKLDYLDMSFNNIPHLFNDTFEGLKNLKFLSLKNCTIYRIKNGTFLHTRKLTYLNLQNNFFITNNYPQGITEGMFEGLENLEVLLLGGNGATYFSKTENPFSKLKSIRRLGLERNFLLSISPDQFSSLSQLEIVDVSYNLLKAWQDRVFAANDKLRVVLMNHNKLTYLSPAMLEDFYNLTKLSLAYNSFACDCSSYNYFNSFIVKCSRKVIAKVLKPAEAVCLTPYVSSNHVIYNVLDYFENVEKGFVLCDIDQRLVVLLPLVLLVVCFVSLASLAFYYRWHIKYWVFLARLQLSRNGKLQSKEPNQAKYKYEYDAFVSYSNEDRNFVVRLVSMLENYEPFLKLCVYERDFHVGHFISDCVLSCIAKSRKTVLVVSDNYAKSQWCRWESHIAEHHRLFFENEDGEYVDDALVVIKLGPVSKDHMTPMLRYLLKTRIYLQWEAEEKKQKLFWNKLRNTLYSPKTDQVAEITHM